MARGSGINLIGAICSQGSLFLIMALLATRTSKSTVGGYAECYAVLTLLSLLSLAGFRAAMTRFVAIHLADGDAGAVRGTIAFGLTLTVAGAVVIAVALAMLAKNLALAFHDDTLRVPLLLVALALPASTFECVALAATQGWRSQRAYAVVGSIVDPGLRLILTIVLLLLGGGLVSAVWALVIATWVGAALSGVALSRRVRTVARQPRRYVLRPLFAFSMISWGSTLATTGLVWADTLLLGRLATQRDVGVYTVASRLVTVAIFVMMPITNAFTPHLAHLFHVADREGAARVYGAATRWIVRLSMPAFVALLIFPADLLNIFGSSYRDAATVTILLAIGQLVSAVVGPAGAVLNMSGHVGLSLADGAAVLALNVGLNLWLIPRHGILGAAIAWCVSLTVVNVVQALQVRWTVRVHSVGVGLVQTATAALAAAGAAVVVRITIDGWLPTVVLGCVTVVVVFGGVLMTVGIGPDDRALLGSRLRHGAVQRPVGAPSNRSQ